MRRVLISLAALAIAACSDTPVADGANNTAGLNEVIAEANQAAEVAHETADEGSSNGETSAGTRRPDDGATAATIPAEYQGRWGMAPADCTSTRGDAKGLITIGDRTVRFYESVATLREQRPSAGTGFSGLFAFTGEGQSWQKVMTFTRTGDILLRAEEGGRYTYRRC